MESAGDLLLRRFSVAIKFVIISVSSPARVCLSVRGLCDIRRMSFNNGRPAPLALARSECFARGNPKVGDFTQRLPKLLLPRLMMYLPMSCARHSSSKGCVNPSPCLPQATGMGFTQPLIKKIMYCNVNEQRTVVYVPLNPMSILARQAPCSGRP